MDPEFILLGASGMVGSQVIKTLQKENRSFYISKSRLESYPDILEELKIIKPRFMICSAGISGTPNIDWCETHQEETIFANIVGQLNVARACSVYGVHCTLFGSGVMYDSMQNNTTFSEKDPPNFSNNFYTKQRIILEELLSSFRVLNLRILYPVAKDGHPRSLIPKLLRYSEVTNTPTSLTVTDDLFPLIPKMCDLGLTGTFNFANPGIITNGQILALYQKYVDKEHVWKVSSSLSNRGHPRLDVSKLLSYFPDIPNVQDSIESMIEDWKHLKESSSIREPHRSHLYPEFLPFLSFEHTRETS